jgi:hypothetical protein
MGKNRKIWAFALKIFSFFMLSNGFAQDILTDCAIIAQWKALYCISTLMWYTEKQSN